MADEVRFEASVVRELAGSLYTRAAGLALRYSILGLVIGGVPLGVLCWVRPATEQMMLLPLTISCAVLGLTTGLGVARTRAEQLRLEAQTALCLLEMEQRNRAAVPAGAPEQTVAPTAPTA